MKISRSFPSKYLKADDIGKSRRIRVIVKGVTMENVGMDGKDETKPIVYFNGAQKGLVLNKTNAGRIAAVYGDETDEWIGKEVLLYVEKVPFQNQMVDSIRVDLPRVEAVGFVQPEEEQPRSLASIRKAAREVAAGLRPSQLDEPPVGALSTDPGFVGEDEVPPF